jgi:hypothetical protein
MRTKADGSLLVIQSQNVDRPEALRFGKSQPDILTTIAHRRCPVRSALFSFHFVEHAINCRARSNKDNGHEHLMSNPISITSVKSRNVPESDVAEIHIYIYI